MDLQRTLVATLSTADEQLNGIGPAIATLESQLAGFEISMTALDTKVREVDEACAVISAREVDTTEIKVATENIGALKTETTDIRQELHNMQMRLLEMDKRVKANEEWREKLGEM